MPTSYPGAFDALTNPATTDPLTSPSHAGQHADANDAIEALQVLLGRSGTSFPGSPASGARFLRTDRNINYFYDGTRWLSTQLFTTDFGYPRALAPYSTANTLNGTFPHPTYDIYAETFYGGFNVQTTNDGSNYWTATYSGVVLSTQGNTPSTWTASSVAKNAVVANDNRLEVTLAKTGAPGNAFLVLGLTYRLVG